MELHWVPLLLTDLKRILGEPSGVGADTWGLLIGLLLLYAGRSKAKLEARLSLGRADELFGVASQTKIAQVVIEPELMEELRVLVQRKQNVEAIKLLRERKNIDPSQAKRIVVALTEIPESES